MTPSTLPAQTDLTLPAEWDHELNDEELSATSREEACKVFEQWQSDHEQEEQDLDIMEVDEQIGSNLLGEDIFGSPCLSPTGPLEELVYMNIEEEDERFFAPLDLSDELRSSTGSGSDASRSHPFDERYQASLKKLQESMKRSQETRKSLTMKTPKTEEYPRTKSVSGVLSSIEMSSHQLQNYLQTIQRQI
jgi:hypothetical protein